MTGGADWKSIHARVERACHDAGLDLVHPFGVGNQRATPPSDEGLVDFGRSNALGLLIGNTRQLWPAFARAYRADAELARNEHPLDTYVSDRVARAAAEAGSTASKIVLSHVTTPRAFPIQRLAARVGFASLAPCHLAIHSTHGLWFALRAVVTFDCAGPEPASALPHPCAGCAAPCVAALERAVQVSAGALTRSAIAARADDWMEVRRVCPVGQSSRYGEAQLRYHYLHDRSLITL